MLTIFGIVVITNDGFLNRTQEDSPAYWASTEDQQFYLNKMINEKPLCIMGINTYYEIQRIASKNSIYQNFNIIVLNDKINYNNEKFIINPDNSKHIYTKLNSEDALEDIKFYSDIFQNKNISILGGSITYEFFLPLYNEFFLTIEENINFNNGIKLFNDCNNNEEIKQKFLNNKMNLFEKQKLSNNTNLYIFKR